MYKIISTVIASVVLALSGLVAAPALADSATQVCWADPADLIHHPLTIESDRDDDALNGMIVRPFPNNALGCASYDGTPLQPWEALYGDGTPPPAAEPCANESASAAYWHNAYDTAHAEANRWMMNYYSLGKLVDRANARGDRLAARVQQQRAKIKRLQAQLSLLD